MALVTQANVDAVKAIRVQVLDLRRKVINLDNILDDVLTRIDLDNPLNADTDWDEIVAIYISDWNTAVSNVQTAANALP